MTRRAWHELLTFLTIAALLLATPVTFGLLTGGR